ncbi:hypothetical protein CDL15_Pgr024215 [Punica granatum]|uniref:Uncharacterized protein n=1 Tax=Punica granatum TaxID=22663 RepID=A0A218XWN7_PUNGR|nr:hypothetical protein CDL15_Pgr024215 [Punica granatum]
MDPTISVAVEIAKSLIVPVGRQFGYALFYRKNIKALKSEVDKLCDARIGFENRCSVVVRNGEIVDKEVLKWLEEAKAKEEKAINQLKDWEVTIKRCFNEWIPNTKTRYFIGGKAKKTVLAIQELLREGKFEVICYPYGRLGEGKVQVICHPDVPEAAPTKTPGIVTETEGEDAPPVEGNVIDPTMKQDYVVDLRTSFLKLVVESRLGITINNSG